MSATASLQVSYDHIRQRRCYLALDPFLSFAESSALEQIADIDLSAVDKLGVPKRTTNCVDEIFGARLQGELFIGNSECSNVA